MGRSEEDRFMDLLLNEMYLEYFTLNVEKKWKLLYIQGTF